MKKISIIILILCFIVIFTGCSNNQKATVVLKSQNMENIDSSWTNIEKDGVLRFAVSPEDLPFLLKTSAEDYQGYLIDVAKETAQRLDLKAEFVELKDNPPVDFIISGNAYIILNGYGYAEHKSDKIKWLSPFLRTQHIIVCHKNIDAKTKEDLLDYRIGVTEDTMTDFTAQTDSKIDNNSLVKYENEKASLNAFKRGETDALIIDSAYFYYYERNNINNYNIFDEITYSHSYSFGISKESNQLAIKLDEVLKEMMDDGTLSKLSEKWFYTDLTK